MDFMQSFTIANLRLADRAYLQVYSCKCDLRVDRFGNNAKGGGFGNPPPFCVLRK